MINHSRHHETILVVKLKILHVRGTFIPRKSILAIPTPLSSNKSKCLTEVESVAR